MKRKLLLIEIHSIPIQFIPFHSIPFQSIPFHVLPNAQKYRPTRPSINSDMFLLKEWKDQRAYIRRVTS